MASRKDAQGCVAVSSSTECGTHVVNRGGYRCGLVQLPEYAEHGALHSPESRSRVVRPLIFPGAMQSVGLRFGHMRIPLRPLGSRRVSFEPGMTSAGLCDCHLHSEKCFRTPDIRFRQPGVQQVGAEVVQLLLYHRDDGARLVDDKRDLF